MEKVHRPRLSGRSRVVVVCAHREAGVEFLELPQTGVVRRLASRNGWNRHWEQ
jgi:hypothetical protein